MIRAASILVAACFPAALHCEALHPSIEALRSTVSGHEDFGGAEIVRAKVSWPLEDAVDVVQDKSVDLPRRDIEFKTWSSANWSKPDANAAGHNGRQFYSIAADPGYSFSSYLTPVAQAKALNGNADCSAKASISAARDVIHVEIDNGLNTSDGNPVCVAQLTAIEFRSK